MIVLLFGSTGRVGSAVLSKLLASDHSVIAFVRNKKKLGQIPENLTVIEGDVLDKDAASLLGNLKFNAIINAIGADPLKPSTLYNDATRLIVEILSNKKEGRYIGITGIAQMEKTFLGKIVIGILKRTPVKNAILDHQNAIELIKSSSLNWTLVGCPYIIDGPEKGKYHTDSKFRGGFKIIHPGDVAGALVHELDQNHSKKIVGIWY